MLPIIAIIVVLLVAALLVKAATKPDILQIQRSALIQAPPEAIYPYIADFKNWKLWSPYEKLDPNMTKTLSGAPNGVGAVYTWSGNRKAGEGRMEISETVPPTKVIIKLDFTRPMRANYIADFTLAPSGGVTMVTWEMHAPNPYIGKVVGTVINMDRMIGRDFETGLAALKALAEG
jgi:hypothetical protein